MTPINFNFPYECPVCKNHSIRVIFGSGTHINDKTFVSHYSCACLLCDTHFTYNVERTNDALSRIYIDNIKDTNLKKFRKLKLNKLK